MDSLFKLSSPYQYYVLEIIINTDAETVRIKIILITVETRDKVKTNTHFLMCIFIFGE